MGKAVKKRMHTYPGQWGMAKTSHSGDCFFWRLLFLVLQSRLTPLNRHDRIGIADTSAHPYQSKTLDHNVASCVMWLVLTITGCESGVVRLLLGSDTGRSFSGLSINATSESRWVPGSMSKVSPA